MVTIQQIIDYIEEHISDPVPKYILIKEIYKKAPSSNEYLNAYNDMKQSKWYRELADDQWENGSWGKFHGGDTEAQKRQKFGCTETALRRARELSLTKDDPIVDKCIKIMEKYITREEPYPDYVERHQDGGKGFYFGIPFGVAANINIFDPDNPVVKPFRDVVVETLKKAFANGYYDEEVYEQEVRNYRVATSPGSVFNAMLLQNSNCMEDTLQRQYLNYVWNKKDGIWYVSKFPIAEKRNVEDKSFHAWFAILECLCNFSLFPEFIKDDVLPHLFNEVSRLINEDVSLPTPPSGYTRPNMGLLQ